MSGRKLREIAFFSKYIEQVTKITFDLRHIPVTRMVSSSSGFYTYICVCSGIKTKVKE